VVAARPARQGGLGGNFSYWEPRPRRLAITTPTSGSDEQVDDTILLLVHEINHARYTTSLGEVAQRVVQRTRLRSEQLAVRVERFRGFIEDARVARLGRDADPALGPWIDAHAEMVLRELERGWQEAAPDPIEQATILVYARLFGLTSALDTTPDRVQQLFDNDWGTIERAVRSDLDAAAMTAMRWYLDLVTAAIPAPAV
jgi:hypothetical protein